MHKILQLIVLLCVLIIIFTLGYAEGQRKIINEQKEKIWELEFDLRHEQLRSRSMHKSLERSVEKH